MKRLPVLPCIEDFTGEEPETIRKFYAHLARAAKNEKTRFATHSLDEAKKNPAGKIKSGQTNHQTKK